MYKKIIGLLLFALVVGVSSSQAFGYISYEKTNEIGIAPLWQTVQEIFVDLTITNGAARMTGLVIGHVGTESITVTASLARVHPNGATTNIATFPNLSVNGGMWAWERTHHVARGYQYRLTLMATVIRNGVRESVSISNTAWAH